MTSNEEIHENLDVGVVGDGVVVNDAATAITPPTEEKPTEEATKPKKRGRKPNPEKRTGYFYEEEEEAFKNYVQSTDQEYRDKIFKEKLYPAFTKMIESIGRRYGLFTPSENFDDTFFDTMSFLMTKVNNFDFSKGYKAYSYCGTICKRYMLLKRTQDMKRHENTLQYDMVFSGNKTDDRIDDNSTGVSLQTELINKTVSDIKRIVSDDYTEKLTDNERSVGFALIELLTNWEELFARVGSKKFNKTSAYYFIREFTMLSTKEVRDAMKKYKTLYFFNKSKLI